MSENHREPEDSEEEVPVVECRDGLARITLRGTCNNSFCEKWHPSECLFYKTKSGCRFGKKYSFAHRQVDEPPTKRSKKNDNKSAVAMLKKNDLHKNVRMLSAFAFFFACDFEMNVLRSMCGFLLFRGFTMSTFIVNSSSSNSVSETRNASHMDDVKRGGDRLGGVTQTFGLQEISGFRNSLLS